MNKKEVEALAREAAKGIKTEQGLNDFSRMLKKVTVEAALNAELDVDISRDRDSSFEPQLVKKHQRRLTGMDEKIHCLYAKGMTTCEMTCRMH